MANPIQSSFAKNPKSTIFYLILYAVCLIGLVSSFITTQSASGFAVWGIFGAFVTLWFCKWMAHRFGANYIEYDKSELWYIAP